MNIHYDDDDIDDDDDFNSYRIDGKGHCDDTADDESCDDGNDDDDKYDIYNIDDEYDGSRLGYWIGLKLSSHYY